VCDIPVRPEAEERPLLEDVTKKRSEGHNWEHWPVWDSDLYRVVTGYVLKFPITGPDSVYNHPAAWKF
jgi:hypothetical protein